MKKGFTLLFLLTGLWLYAQETITISGQARDFDGNPVDSCVVRVLNPDFTIAYYTYTDKNGYYMLDNVKKGKYMAIYAMRPKEYPTENAVPLDEQRLEFWAWNVIADRNLTIDPHYQRLELYGTHVFRVEGGYPGMMIYTRPMSLGKFQNDPQKVEMSVNPEYFDVKIFADEEPLKVNSIQPIQEFSGKGNISLTGYLIQTEMPKNKPDKPYVIFRVEAINKENNEKGENLYFYEVKDYKNISN